MRAYELANDLGVASGAVTALLGLDNAAKRVSAEEEARVRAHFAPDGERPEDHAADGERPDDLTADGARPDDYAADGERPDAHAADGDVPTETPETAAASTPVRGKTKRGRPRKASTAYRLVGKGSVGLGSSAHLGGTLIRRGDEVSAAAYAALPERVQSFFEAA